MRYGRLERILECNLPDDQAIWGAASGTRLLLAIITPCLTRKQDATQSVVSYRLEHQSPVTVDLNAVESLIGRVASRGQWGIIDQSTTAARTVFVEETEDQNE